MPTPVSSARHCLTGEAATALDEAVAVARRRCHAQTSSLHVVSALLSLPSTSTSSSSILRDALARARSAACSPRLQFKALELCFSVALDRLPSSSSNSSSSDNGPQPSGSPSEPPVSNSLMAAIKRSQANQRRNPETFHLYQQQLLQQQQTPQSPTFSGVKVELQQLILAILDDPVVSRVFGEAGFRSCDIKYAVLRPPPTSILRFPLPTRCPPLFLCNFSTTGDEFGTVSHQSFSFPFSKQVLYTDGSDENCRRIGEVLIRKKGRNPLLVGAGATEALQDLAGVLGKEKWSSLPQEMLGLKFFSLEKDLSNFVGGGRERASLETRIEKLISMLSSSGSGVVVSIGDLKGFLDERGNGGESKQEGLDYMVSELTRLIGDDEGLNGKMWLVCSSASYETYMKFLAKFPSVDKDWDLQLLPITSVRGGSQGMLPKTSSLMDSIPSVGFLPVASNSSASPSRPYQSVVRCDHCNDKYDEEVAALLKENSVPVPELQKSTCSIWLQKAPLSFGKSDMTMARDNSRELKDKVADLEKKWNDVCQRLHSGSNRFGETNASCEGSESFSSVVGFPNVSDKGSVGFPKSISTQDQVGLEQEKILPTTVSLEKSSSAMSCLSTPPVVPEPPKVTHSSESARVADCLLSPLGSQSGNHSSVPSVSVSTDLMLGRLPISTDMNTMSNPTTSSGVARCFSLTNPDVVNGSMTVTQAKNSVQLSYNSPLVGGRDSALSPSSSNPKFSQAGESKFMIKGLSSSNSSSRFDPGEFKSLCRNLVDKVRRQEEAIFAVSEAVTRCRSGNGRHGFAGTRGGIWLRFLGTDRVGKKMIAGSLAELLFENKENLICVDLGLQQDGSSNPFGICDEGCFGGYNENVRGKMVVDHISDELRRLPWSVVLLENVDKADFLVQNSLNQAIKTGRFPDSHGREISTSNKVFIMTTSEARERTNSPVRGEVAAVFCEEKILAAQKWQMKISIDSALKPLSVSRNTDQFSPPPIAAANKRKLNNTDDTDQESRLSETAKRVHRSSNSFPDLNVPFEATTADDSSDDSNCRSSDTSTSWLDDFFPNVDETVVLRPFDFDALAELIRKKITRTFDNTIGSNCKLEIDQKAMEQILAATWLSEGNDGPLNDWAQSVLGRSFAEARERYNLSAHTVVRLVSCEDVLIAECAPGIRLPPRIPLD